MRERGSLRVRLFLVSLLVSVALIEDIEKIEAKCEVSGMTKILLKDNHILPSLRVNVADWGELSSNSYWKDSN